MFEHEYDSLNMNSVVCYVSSEDQKKKKNQTSTDIF